MDQRQDLTEDKTVKPAAPAQENAAIDLGKSGTVDDPAAKAIDRPVLNNGLEIDGNFEIVEPIGSGGMGDVYLGKDLLLGRPVAIKIMHQSLSSEHVIRFQREAQILGRLSHPHIAPIYQLGVSDQGKPYIVMEYVDGTALSQIIANESPLNPYWVLNVVQQLADALKAAHDAGITHRDLKPANILVAKDSNGFDTLKVIDFGIAKDISSKQDLTRSGEIFGSPFYMSPEQCTGGPVDYRADIYSAGCIIFEMLTGKRPFQGASILETASMHMTAAPTPLPKHLKIFNYVLSKMLAKKPEDRYQNIAQAHLDLLAAVLKWGQFRFSPFMFNDLMRVRRLPKHSPRPLVIAFSLLALSLVPTACAFVVPVANKSTALSFSLVLIFLALGQFLRILWQPVRSLKEKEKLLAKGPELESGLGSSQGLSAKYIPGFGQCSGNGNSQSSGHSSSQASGTTADKGFS